MPLDTIVCLSPTVLHQLPRSLLSLLFLCAPVSLFSQVFHQLDELLPFDSSVPLDDLLAVTLLLFFGVTTLKVRFCETKPMRNLLLPGL